MVNTERFDEGREHRNVVPLEAHTELPDDPDRPDPVNILVDQDQARLQQLVPIRHGRMRVTPFTFYRGGAAIMASDLSQRATTDLRVQLCGDAHLSNFGIFNGPDRRLVFDVNDFDETASGPFEWDLKRLATSVTIAGRNNGFAPKEIRRVTRASVRGYREVLAEAAHLSPLDVHYHRIEVESILATASGKRRKKMTKIANKALRKDSMRALNKLTTAVFDRSNTGCAAVAVAGVVARGRMCGSTWVVTADSATWSPESTGLPFRHKTGVRRSVVGPSGRCDGASRRGLARRRRRSSR